MPGGSRDRTRGGRAARRAEVNPSAAEPSSPAMLLTIDQLLRHARKLSREQQYSTAPGPRVTPLLDLVDRAERVLTAFHRDMSAAVRDHRAVPPATEWLLDNEYLVDEQLLRIRKDLPKGYGSELPHLTAGPFVGFPRIYEAIVSLVEHTDARLDEDYLYRYVRAYQESSPMTIGETWAIPIVLRAALVHNLGMLAELVGSAHEADTSADEWADALLATGLQRPALLGDYLARVTADRRRLGTRFLLRLHLRLRDQEVIHEEVAEWLAAQIAALPASLESLRTAEHHRQAAQQVSIANTITSIRFVNALDWRRFFEGVSVVEAALREDPTGVYDRMDFASRDRYRNAVEDLSRRCSSSEVEVARAAVLRASESYRLAPDDIAPAHVGWYLIRGGRYAFEKELGYKPRNREIAYRGPLRRGGLIFWSLLGAVTATLAGTVAVHALYRGTPVWATALLCIVAAIPLSEIATVVANRIAIALWPARALPSLDHRLRLTAAQRTLVVVVALVRSAEEAQELTSRLEVNYLTGYRDPNVHFALVCEPMPADEENLPEDDDIRQTALDSIRHLNQTHGLRGTRPFHLFARHRTWHQSEGAWMAWERKRGALLELCGLLRGRETSFHILEGDDEFLSGVEYILTLDADTMLPRDGVKRLVSVITHPLNLPVIDPDRRRVINGHGVVQPRVTHSLSSSNRSRYSWMHTGSEGIDPYGGVVSDVYQDVFGEGSFTGKAVFRVDAFLEVLEHRFPEAQVLSHDLLEGNYLRCGLATDIEVFDEYPSTYASAVVRQHRWTRGDWQLLPWLFPRVSTTDGTRERNVLTALQRWKIVDNLRRSLVAPALMSMIVVGWALIPGPDPWWLAIILGITFFPAILQFLESMLNSPRKVSLKRSLTAVVADLRRDVSRALFALATLPHQAWNSVDAIGRALWRQYVSRRLMLEWMTAAEAESLQDASRRGHLRSMGPAAAVGVLAALPAIAAVPLRSLYALPVLGLWIASPLLAHASSAPVRHKVEPVTTDDLDYLRRIARMTWRFFETFVTPEDHWLVPDNFQEVPSGVMAHRTSPTNIGLQLLSYGTAYDMGYIGVPALVELTMNTLTVLAGLKRFRGHFYNWYDTRTLEPLPPGYVSTVDSGNLCGNLIALRHVLREAVDAPIVDSQTLAGLADTIRTALSDAEAALGKSPSRKAPLEGLRAALELILEASIPETLPAWLRVLRTVEAQAALSVATLLEVLPTGSPARNAVEDVLECVRRRIADLETYAPWAHTAASLPGSLAASDLPESIRPYLDHVPSLVELAECEAAVQALDKLGEGEEGAVATWCDAFAGGMAASQANASQMLGLAELAMNMANEMWLHTDFRVVYEADRKLFAIGFNTADGRRDPSYYDILASECRLASFLAVAKGDAPQSHWFRLGRAITTTSEGYALLSWSASMFEYLMPLLVMKSWAGTLLDETYYTVVRRHMEYGRQQRVPWGVSESAFNTRDADQTYQYQAFGVPGLGLKRGLLDDVVVAPYATMLALPIAAHAAVANLRALQSRGALGRYGFYEAIDYTPGRIPAGAERAIVRAYMAHHQGMSFVSLGNMLASRTMRDRFHEDPLVRSAEVLLQERAPRHIEIEHPNVEEVEFVRSVRELAHPHARSYPLANTPVPATHFLSNGSYSVMVTNAGGGYSRWRGVEVSRYREDVTRDCWGTFLYIHAIETDEVWSATYQPIATEPDDYHVTFSADKAEYRRLDGDTETHTEIVVSPEHDVEVRRLTLTNHGRETQTLEVTSYFEASLSPHGADQAHRAFANLFVETETFNQDSIIMFTRRPRSDEESRLWGFHALACESTAEWRPSVETSRPRFLGRLRQPFDPAALDSPGALSGTTGPVLDPCCSIRQTVTLDPGETARLAFTTGVSDDRDEALALALGYCDIRTAQRALDLSWTSSQIVLRDLGILPEEAVVFQRLASRLLLTDPYSTLKVKTPVENGLPLSALWSLGISGDHPILLARIERLEDTPIVRQLLLAHQYWRHTGLVSDLVILNTQPSSYSSELHERLALLVHTGHALELMDRPGGIFLRRADQMTGDVRNLLETVSRAVIDGDRGSLLLQLNQRGRRPELPPALIHSRAPDVFPAERLERPTLAFDCGYGGYDADTGEYVVFLEDGDSTPAPWINVFANDGGFGALVSEAGIGCSWAINSHENRVTTWNNDAVSDGSGEVVYIRDEDTGEVWSPTLLPKRSPGTHVVRHGRGYSVFRFRGYGIDHTMTLFVPPRDPVLVALLELKNEGTERRTLTATKYIEWAIGPSRSQAQQRVVTWYDSDFDFLTAHNHFNLDFPGRAAFLASDRPVESFTGSRTEFIGRNGSPADPLGLKRARLAAQTGRFHDSCGALQVRVSLEPGQTTTVAFFVGQTDDLERARELVARYRAPDALDAALAETRAFWDDLLDTLEIETPDTALDYLVNGPLLYQTLACRLWGRTATYQSSGAFGFRDQLQDSLALLLARPDIVRERIVDAARHQFPEGDVMHWWMPVSDRGVRTRIMDDRHWLPFVVARYVEATGDLSVLDEVVHYLDGADLAEEQEDLYFEPRLSEQSGTVYEHCVAALDSAKLGSHGLPLMGGGDWNDGMNRVGRKGRGESVWLAWFLDVTMRAFADVAELVGEADQAIELRRRAESLVEAVDRDAWDGDWYLRAFFDDGSPLGTHDDFECRIDAIAQAWAALSGRGDAERVERALSSVDTHLVDEEVRIVRLLDPPFDTSDRDPGYIKGYLPGIRENGGQYTHAAIWVALAHLARGNGDRGYELLKLLNPLEHALDRESAERYVVEPYAVAADVYANPTHLGRGGWTWYTGSASWFLRAATEGMLGLQRRNVDGRPALLVDPCLPREWTGYSATYRFISAAYRIIVEKPKGICRGRVRIEMDGEMMDGRLLPLEDDGANHQVRIVVE